MRTTIVLDDDVAAAVERLRLSQAVNELVRAGLRVRQGRKRFRQHSHSVGPRVDVSNVAEGLELLDGPGAR